MKTNHIYKIKEYSAEGDFNPEVYISNACGSYDEMGDALTQFLAYFAGSGEWDERVADLLTDIAAAVADDEGARW